MSEKIPGLLGKLAPVHQPTLHLSNFATIDRYPSPVVDVSGGIANWDMLGNDRLRDCLPAATEHLRMAKAVSGAGPLGRILYQLGFRRPHTAYTEKLYYEFGISQNEPPPFPDQGASIYPWLQWLFQRGIIEGFAEIDQNPANVDAQNEGSRTRIKNAMSQFHGCLLGMELTPNSMNRWSRNLPWIVGPNPLDQPSPTLGHAVALVGFEPAYARVVTWGQRQLVSWDYIDACVDECWVILTKEDAVRNGVDFPALLTAIKALPNGQGL